MRTLKRRLLISLLFVGLLGTSTNVDAKFYERSENIGDGLTLVGSISADYVGGEYVNGDNPQLFLKGISNMRLDNPFVKLQKSGIGYELSYRASIVGEIPAWLSASLGTNGFKIEAKIGTTFNVYKYVSGTFYIYPSFTNECRGGICKFELTPSLVTK